MSPFKRARALSRSWAGHPITCPHCGQEGFDSHGLPPEKEHDALFEIRGHKGSKPVRKCLRCGGGILIKGAGRTEAIPQDQWAQMEVYWAEERERIEDELRTLFPASEINPEDSLDDPKGRDH